MLPGAGGDGVMNDALDADVGVAPLGICTCAGNGSSLCPS